MGAINRLLGMLLLGWPLLVNAAPRALCVFSVAGAQGEPWGTMQDFAAVSAGWGAPVTLRPMTDERIAAEDLKAGICDAALITGIRARQFNAFAGSLDAIGGLPDYESLRMLITVLTRPELAPSMRQGPYEVAGILPLGAAYLFLNDRRINSVEKMAGKRLAVLEHDPAQRMMATRIGAQAVSSDVVNFAGKFNNGVVDVVAAPALAYLPLELYRGVGAKGVVLDLPVAQLTLQLVMRHERFPEGYGDKARQWLAEQFSPALRHVQAAEAEMLFFFPPPDADRDRYRLLLQDARIALMQGGFYHPRMMRLMKRVRCTLDPSQAECSNDHE